MNKTDLQGRYLGKPSKSLVSKGNLSPQVLLLYFGFSTRRKLKGSKQLVL